MNTTTDTRQETFLTQVGADWTYTNKVSEAQLKPGWERNIARPRNKVEEAIINYGVLLESGSPAPAPILRETEAGFEVLDGVQRISALILLGVTEFAAYVVTTDSDKLARTIRVIANHRLQGHPEPAAWTKAHAVDMLCLEDGLSVEEVARLGGWKVPDIKKVKERRITSFAITSIGGPSTGNKGLSFGTVDAITEASHLDDFRKASKPIAEFCHALVKGRFINGEWQPLIDNFFKVNRKRGKLHEQFDHNLERFMQNPEVMTRLEGRTPSRRRGETQVIAALKAARSIVEKAETSQVPIHNMDEAYNIVRQIRQGLERIHKYSKKAAVKA